MISPQVRSVSPQEEPAMNDFGIQCIIRQFNCTDKDESFQSDYESNESEYRQSGAYMMTNIFQRV